jgi:DNA modification methylase
MRQPYSYKTKLGEAYCGDSKDLLKTMDSDTVDLVMTSPPFALLREKEYGNVLQDDYVSWLEEFAREVKRVLKPTGSFVLDLGGAYQRGRPVRSLYNYNVLIRFCSELGFNLAEEFFWFNPSKLPSPIEWVNKRKIRVKDAVNTVWWFSKTDHPKADVTKVLAPYSDRMKKLLNSNGTYYKPKLRPSGHDISDKFKDNGGAIPSNLLQIPNSESSSRYLRLSRLVGVTSHPARFPIGLPMFFIKFLTDEDDLVVDIFSGSNTTGQAAESLGRRWLAFDNELTYVASSAIRFLHAPLEKMREIHARLLQGENVDLAGMQLEADLEDLKDDQLQGTLDLAA